MSRRSAVVRIILERKLLLERVERGEGGPSGYAARLDELVRLLFDVRAGRLGEFVLPADNPISVFISAG